MATLPLCLGLMSAQPPLPGHMFPLSNLFILTVHPGPCIIFSLLRAAPGWAGLGTLELHSVRLQTVLCTPAPPSSSASGESLLSVDRKLRGCCPIWLSEGQGAYTQSDAMFTVNMPSQEVEPYGWGYRTSWGSGNGVQRVAVERMEQTPDSA